MRKKMFVIYDRDADGYVCCKEYTNKQERAFTLCSNNVLPGHRREVYRLYFGKYYNIVFKSKNEFSFVNCECGSNGWPVVRCEPSVISFFKGNHNDVSNFEYRYPDIYKTPACYVRDFCINAFFWDELCEEIKPEITFCDVVKCLNENPDGFYDFIGVGDSIVREYIFHKLAELLEWSLECPYNDIYDRWLGDGKMLEI